MTENEELTGIAVVGEVDGTVREIPWPYPPTNGANLELLYREINCDTVEAVSLYPITGIMPDLPEMTMWIDEVGKLNNRETNVLADAVAAELYQAIREDDFIVGTALFTGGVDDEGWTLPLTRGALELLRSVVV